MKATKYLPGLILVLAVILPAVLSASVETPPAAVTPAESSEEDSKEKTSTTTSTTETSATTSTNKPSEPTTAAASVAAPVAKGLETSESDVVELKVEHKAEADADEKLGTSDSLQVGYTSNFVPYDAPLQSGAYAGQGRGGGFVKGLPGFSANRGFPRGYVGTGPGRDQVHAAGQVYKQFSPNQGQFLPNDFNGFRNGQFAGAGYPGQFIGGGYQNGQRLASHTEVIQGYPVLQNEAAYGRPAYGVAYAGHGAGRGHEAAEHGPVAYGPPGHPHVEGGHRPEGTHGHEGPGHLHKEPHGHQAVEHGHGPKVAYGHEGAGHVPKVDHAGHGPESPYGHLGAVHLQKLPHGHGEPGHGREGHIGNEGPKPLLVPKVAYGHEAARHGPEVGYRPEGLGHVPKAEYGHQGAGHIPKPSFGPEAAYGHPAAGHRPEASYGHADAGRGPEGPYGHSEGARRPEGPYGQSEGARGPGGSYGEAGPGRAPEAFYVRPEAPGHGGPGHHGEAPKYIPPQGVVVNRLPEIGVGPYGEAHHRVEGAHNKVEGATPIGSPYSPYGQGGVVYMGNGLVSEHEAGLQAMGPVLPPPKYPQQNFNKYAERGPYEQVQKGIYKEPVSELGHGERERYPEQGRHEVQQIYRPAGFGRNPEEYSPGVQKQLENAVDPYRREYEGVAVQKAVGTLGGPNPGLGYNGQEIHAKAHQDQAILTGQGQGGRGELQYNRERDPYYNTNLKKVDPVYRRPESEAPLQTTGPNRFYEGKDPAGVYERYHRLG